MGGVISTATDFVVKEACTYFCLEVNHMCRLIKNLDALEKAMGKLKAKRDDVLGRVEMDEDTGLQRFSEVQQWLTSVGTIENDVHEMRRACTREQGLALYGICSNLDLRFHYGGTVFSMLEDVKQLTDRDFIAVAGPPMREVAEERPMQPIVGQDIILERAWNHLKNDRTKIVGIFGMGGVGKTTLLNQINNRFCHINDGVDVVIWVVVSKNATVHKMQRDVGEKLNFKGKEWDEKDEDQRARDIHNVLKKKRFVLLLDDMWEKVNLSTIGVPYPSRENGCKVAFTTRSRDICGYMGVNDPIEVRCLDPEKAWDLFQEKVGENTLGSHPDIPKLARKVARECRGLPLAINAIGESMSCKTTVREWCRTIDVLSLAASEFSSMENEILPVLKYSYDSLNDEKVKSCFLYCSLFPEDYRFEKESLIEYWIAEGFIDVMDGRERALNQGYEILGTLVRACLLLEGIRWDGSPEVKMHDVVRDMALWIASDFGKHKERCIVQVGVGLLEIPKVDNWKTVNRMSLMKNDIEMISKSHECPQLTTLLLRENKYLGTISGEFFQSMPKLFVLDLSGSESFKGLPEEISKLVSLRYLGLSYTKIEGLPVGLQNLKMLIHLNLENTSELESLHGISNLSSLRTLKLQRSKVWLDKSLMKELQLLEHLEFISVTISLSLVEEQLLYDSRVGRCIQELSIEDRSEESIRVLHLPAIENLREVIILNCMMEEIKIEKTTLDKSLTSPCLISNLCDVLLEECDGVKDLTWLLFAPNLTRLAVWRSKKIEEIISEEKAASLLGNETGSIIPFQRLQLLYLQDLPELKSIYWNALPFQRLKSLEVLNCPKVRKLPLDSRSVGKVEDLVINYGFRGEEWIERVEWEDEATRQRFLPQSRK